MYTTYSFHRLHSGAQPWKFASSKAWDGATESGENILSWFNPFKFQYLDSPLKNMTIFRRK